MLLAGWAFAAGAEPLKDIALPAPRKEGGKPLMQALAERRSGRDYSPRKLDPQTLANLLWAANGINRDSGMRTAPTARNWQEIEVYAVLEDGAYLYDPKANALKPVAEGDLRKITGQQDFAATAPLNLVFVADTTRMKGAQGPDVDKYAYGDTGFVSQNVYLFCASEGLATVVRGLVDRKALAEALKLPDTKKIIFAQTVGYPADAKP
jgi:SagB-type dehydrogenase family enzyme